MTLTPMSNTPMGFTTTSFGRATWAGPRGGLVLARYPQDLLVGGFNPLKNISQIGNLPKGRGEHIKSLKPLTSLNINGYPWNQPKDRTFST